jgi:16S rRNA (cytosine1402-N4)-methyltransferase
MATHVPVMCAEVVDLVRAGRGGLFVDCTVGLGGHTLALLEAGAARVIGFDRDAEALEAARARLSARADAVDLVHADFRTLGAVLDERGIAEVDGIVADLGVSSLQLEGEERGFSFQHDGPLDMRMDRTRGRTAAELIAEVSEPDLADIIFAWGEERHSRRIARAIVRARAESPMQTTRQLAAAVRRATPRRGHMRIDPATRTFQALRIWVNDELEGLDAFLVTASARLTPGGRLVVMAFQSLEDRIVKHAFRRLEREGATAMRVVTRKPRVPGADEVQRNPRARSAKLRAVERVA